MVGRKGGSAKIAQSNLAFQADLQKDKVLSHTCDQTSQKLVTKRKVIWKHNAIRMTRANPLPDNKAVRSKIVRDRNVNANNASAKNKAVAANRVAGVSRADDNGDCLGLT